MDDESEKMVALKKAYAEVILNTAKEAAARVIASERRAVRFQHDLNATKEETLRMLLRLREMIDSETTEADINCISQRRRIEELEAQLGETEDKILELRVELKKTTAELDSQKKNQLQLHDSCKSTEIAVASEDETQTPLTIVPYSSDSDLESSRKTDEGCLSLIKEAKKLNFSHLEGYLSHGSDVASLIMGTVEAELSRNGCTQRVRAFKDEGRVRVGKRKRSVTRRKSSLSGKKKKKMEKANKAEVEELPVVSGLKRRRQEQDNDVTIPKTLDNCQKPVVAKESRFLRYTCRRTRKKETSGYCDERDENLEDSKESGSIDECSRDSRRLAQVARQLISLSGRKW